MQEDVTGKPDSDLKPLQIFGDNQGALPIIQ
jgi:hypothetical protein